MDDVDNKAGMKFWIAALAFSMLLLATTFALLATYLAEIKDNTSTALTRTDIIAGRLNSLDMELAYLHHAIVERKAGGSALSAPNEATSAAPTAPATEPATMQGAEKPAAPASSDVPVIQPPAMTPPASAPAKP